MSQDGVRLRGWLVKGKKQPRSIVVYFGGNAEEVSWLVGIAEQFAGWSLLLVNFRGYGDSEGKPGERALLSDGLRVYDYTRARPDVDPERIALMGRSLGSGVAVHVAGHRHVLGVILASPYDSLTAVAKHHYPFLPVSLMLRHRFDSLVLAPGITAPLLCLVAADDRVIPAERSRVLFDAWSGAKTWLELPRSDHNSVAGESEYWRSIEQFLVSLR